MKRDEDWREKEKKKERAKKSRHLLFLVSKKKQRKNKTQFSAHEQKYKERADVREQMSGGRYQRADQRAEKTYKRTLAIVNGSHKSPTPRRGVKKLFFFFKRFSGVHQSCLDFSTMFNFPK